MKKPRKYLFIVTYGRSGSTLLMKLVGSIDGYHIKGENANALLGLYQSFAAAQEARNKFGITERGPDDPWYGADQIRPRIYASRLVEIFVQEIIKPPADARVVGFKEIRYNERPELFRKQLNFMHDFFQPAKFVFNLRAAEDVGKSGWWKQRPLVAVQNYVDKFKTVMDGFMTDHPKHCIAVDYNQYSRDPTALKPLFEFLGESFDERRITEILGVRLTH